MNKKVVFLTGTRADFGKMNPLMEKIENSDNFKCYVFVTGMHTLSKYGSTYKEVEKKGYSNIYKYINQSNETKMDKILSNTILGFSNYINEIKPDMIVVHGDRLEALAGAIVGAFNNILVAHVEGGEVSGTIDESIRHSITKLSHFHFVANEKAKKRVIQLGEKDENIFIIGSPDIDIMVSNDLPSLIDVKKRYDIDFNKYSIFIYHPVTTKISSLKKNINEVVNALIESKKNYVVIHPNNDEGAEIIYKEIKRLERYNNFRLYPSIRFKYFLTLLKNASFIIGNSSAGIREAGVYGLPCINVGDRQNNRKKSKGVIDVNNSKNEILKSISKAENMSLKSTYHYGNGNSSKKFFDIMCEKTIWENSCQKIFVDIDNL